MVTYMAAVNNVVEYRPNSWPPSHLIGHHTPIGLKSVVATGSITKIAGCLDLLDWSDGMEQWNGLDWNGGMEFECGEL